MRLQFPSGAPFNSAQLHNAGVSNALAAKYVHSGWLKRLEHGTYQFAGDELDKEKTVRFLEARIPGLHVAAKSAMERHGYRQNIAFEETTILWAEGRGQLPRWASEQFRFRFSVRHLFSSDLPIERRVGRLPDAPLGPLVSQPECALLEMLSEVGVTLGVEEARGIMEVVVRVRSSRMIEAVAACRMVKAVRLCVLWAEEFGFAWSDAVRAAVPKEKRTGRWIGRCADGTTLNLPPI